jgi:ATP diphosphatase
MTEPSPLPDGAPIERLRAIMARLRAPVGGCPWDLQQDFASIAPYTIEEAYEVADAIDRKDMADLREELGDLLLQVVFHARMAEEAGLFDFDDVARSINEKMERRHPHVFDAQGRAGAAGRRDAEAQSALWEQGKAQERLARGGGDASALAGIARGLPEWQRAVKLQKRAARVGFDWPDVGPVFDKLHEEIEELRAEFAAGVGHAALEDELGDVLFVCANLSRHGKVDFGAAMRHANAKFERRFRRMEELAAGEGRSLAGQSLAEQDAYWNRAKREEKAGAAAPGEGPAGAPGR